MAVFKKFGLDQVHNKTVRTSRTLVLARASKLFSIADFYLQVAKLVLGEAVVELENICCGL